MKYIFAQIDDNFKIKSVKYLAYSDKSIYSIYDMKTKTTKNIKAEFPEEAIKLFNNQ